MGPKNGGIVIVDEVVYCTVYSVQCTVYSVQCTLTFTLHFHREEIQKAREERKKAKKEDKANRKGQNRKTQNLVKVLRDKFRRKLLLLTLLLLRL